MPGQSESSPYHLLERAFLCLDRVCLAESFVAGAAMRGGWIEIAVGLVRMVGRVVLSWSEKLVLMTLRMTRSPSPPPPLGGIRHAFPPHPQFSSLLSCIDQESIDERTGRMNRYLYVYRHCHCHCHRQRSNCHSSVVLPKKKCEAERTRTYLHASLCHSATVPPLVDR